METPLRIAIFGKSGCEKCKILQHRVDRLLAGGEWPEFEKAYYDVETVDGLVQFCRMECINPGRIPALVVLRREAGGWRPLPRAKPGAPDPVCGSRRLYTHVGLQTDYSDEGKGLISPAMIRAVLEEARAALAAGASAAA